MVKGVSYRIRWFISESGMSLQGESKEFIERVPKLMTKMQILDSCEKINILLVIGSFSSCHNCSDTDETDNFLSEYHDTIFSDSEVASTHSKLSEIPELLYTCGENLIVSGRAVQTV
jgi:hypothetical protein